MTVADLQDILAHIGQVLQSAGSKAPAAELTAFRESLEPFRQLGAKQFASQLTKLFEASQAPPKPPRRAGRAPAADVDSLLREVQDLYARTPEASTTIEQIEEAMKRLEPLTKDALIKVAEGIGLVGMKGKGKKGDIVKEIRHRITSRKGATQRVNLIDRSPFATVEAQVAGDSSAAVP
jgi:hypothetical protein